MTGLRELPSVSRATRGWLLSGAGPPPPLADPRRRRVVNSGGRTARHGTAIHDSRPGRPDPGYAWGSAVGGAADAVAAADAARAAAMGDAVAADGLASLTALVRVMWRPIGTTIGVPATGSGTILTARPKTSSTTSSVITSRGLPSATMAPSFIAIRWSPKRQAWLRSCRTRTIVRSSTCSGRPADRAPRTGGSGRGTSSARPAAGGRSPARAPSRSTPAAADHRTTRRSADPRVESTSVDVIAAATASSSSWSTAGTTAGRGYRPRPTRSATVIPSGAVGDCGNSPSRSPPPGSGAMDRLAVQEHGPVRRLQQPGERPQEGGLAAGVGAHDDGDLPGRDPHRQVVG